MYVADFKKHNVWVIERGETTPQVYFHSDRFNQPNDLAIAADGTLYASDPRFASPAGGQIWRITRGADGKGQGEVMSSTRRLGVTNGIDLSPDGATLYVSESNSRQVWAYRLDGSKLLDPRLVRGFADFEVDGLRTDVDGRIYLARLSAGKIAIIGADGSLQREVPAERKAADQPHLWRSGRQNRLRDPEGRPLHRGVSRRPSRPRAMPASARHVLSVERKTTAVFDGFSRACGPQRKQAIDHSRSGRDRHWRVANRSQHGLSLRQHDCRRFTNPGGIAHATRGRTRSAGALRQRGPLADKDQPKGARAMFEISRRDLVLGSTGAALVFGLKGPVSFIGAAQAQRAADSLKYKVGDIEVFSLHEGSIERAVTEAMVKNASLDDVKKALTAARHRS